MQVKRKAHSHLKNDRGVALLLAIFSMVLAITIATEVSYETQVEFVGSSQGVNQVKAYYAAKSGVELSLLRILLYKKAMAQYGAKMKDQKGILDMIWQLPFSWPPQGLEALSKGNRDDIENVLKESAMDTEYVTTISGEGGRIDINDLGSENEALRNGIHNQILQIFENEKENNREFRDKYDRVNFDELVNDIQDWVDDDKSAASGRGDETSRYEQPDDVKNYSLPPNAPFKTLDELMMVRDMKEDFFLLLKDRITVYGSKGININTAEATVLKALDPKINDDIANAIIQRRSDMTKGGPFTDDKDFFSFLQSKGVSTNRIEESKIPLIFDAEYNFRILSVGQAGNVRREITAISYDIDGITSRVSKLLDEQDKANSGGTSGGSGSGGTGTGGSGSGTGGTGGTGGSGSGATGGANPPTVKVPKGRPTVVYWQET